MRAREHFLSIIQIHKTKKNTICAVIAMLCFHHEVTGGEYA